MASVALLRRRLLPALALVPAVVLQASLATSLGGPYYSFHSSQDPVCVVDTFDIVQTNDQVVFWRMGGPAEEYTREDDTLTQANADTGMETEGSIQANGDIAWMHGYTSRPGSPYSESHNPEQCCGGARCEETLWSCCGEKGDDRWGCKGLYRVKEVGDCGTCTQYECHDPLFSAPILITIIVAPLALYYFGSMGFFWWLTSKANAAAAPVPRCGYVDRPAHAVDIPSDLCSFDSPFYGMGRAEMMPDELAGVMTPAEFGQLFSRINETNRATMGFRMWHLLLWPAMIIFWVVGGFMLMMWGIQRAQSLAITAVGSHVTPFCEEKGISYVLIVGVTNKHASNPTIVRFFLPRDGSSATTAWAA